MKRLLLLPALLVILNCAGAQNKADLAGLHPFNDWDNTEKTLFVAHQVVRTVDLFQTVYIFSHSAFYEINPALCFGVGLIGPAFIPIYFIAVGVAEYFIVDALDPPLRKVALSGATVLSLGLVYHNYSIGIRPAL